TTSFAVTAVDTSTNNFNPDTSTTSGNAVTKPFAPVPSLKTGISSPYKPSPSRQAGTIKNKETIEDPENLEDRRRKRDNSTRDSESEVVRAVVRQMSELDTEAFQLRFHIARALLRHQGEVKGSAGTCPSHARLVELAEIAIAEEETHSLRHWLSPDADELALG